MDLSMPGMDGVAATRGDHLAHPDVAVVVLTSFSDTARITAALDAGAIGYQLKDAAPDELIAAVRAAAAGGAPLDPRAARVLLDRKARQPEIAARAPASGGAPARHRGPRQQADRPPARHRRTHREGAPDEHLRPASGSPTAPRPPYGRNNTSATRAPDPVQSPQSGSSESSPPDPEPEPLGSPSSEPPESEPLESSPEPPEPEPLESLSSEPPP